MIKRALPALVVLAVLLISFLAPVPASTDLAKHCGYGGYGYSYSGHCK